MLRGEKVTLRSVEREDVEMLWRFWNDLEVELAGGGDPPLPVSLQRLRERFDREAREGTQDKIDFVIEADGACIGQCGLFHFDVASRHCELGTVGGEKEWGGRGWGGEAGGLLFVPVFGEGTSGGGGREPRGANARP